MNVDINKLQQRCQMSIEDYMDEMSKRPGALVAHDTDTDERLIFIPSPTGSNVLAVAHLDTATKLNHFLAATNEYGEPCVLSPNLDDRLGAYIILDMLPDYGIYPDILLTTNEEWGCSTAYLFETEKQYNWMFEFDRHGKEAVLYQYDDKKLRSRLGKCRIGSTVGTYSDIRDLEHLGCKGINFGCGYYDEHTWLCHAILPDVEKCVEKFADFHDTYCDTQMPHAPVYRNYEKRAPKEARSEEDVYNWTDADLTRWYRAQELAEKGRTSIKSQEEADLRVMYPRDVGAKDTELWTDKDWQIWADLWYDEPADDGLGLDDWDDYVMRKGQ